MRRVQKRTELASDDAQLGSYPRYLDQQCTALHLPDKFSVVKISLVKNAIGASTELGSAGPCRLRQA